MVWDGVLNIALSFGYTPFIFPLWLTTHRELNTSRRVRMVFDFLAEALSAY